MTDQRLSLEQPGDFPALYVSADRTAARAQTRFFRALRIRLLGLLAAAGGGAVVWSVGGWNAGALTALAAFVVAVGAEIFLAVDRPDRLWYQARAAAESVKTLTWRYAVRGQPFDGASDAHCDKRFRRELAGVLQDLPALNVEAMDQAGTQITASMRQLRAQDFSQRRAVFLRERIEGQRVWYAAKARSNDLAGRRWLLASIAAECLGIMAAAVAAFRDVQIDMLSVFAAIATAVTAWVQAKQHQNLSTAYAVTSQELASVSSEVAAIADEANWYQLVDEAEEAISREHTLWRASRGLGVRRPNEGSP